MKRFCKFSIQNPMDLKPWTNVRIFEGNDVEAIKAEALKYAYSMNHMPCSETTSFVSVLTAKEAIDYINEQNDVAEKWGDDTFLKRSLKAYNDCYNTEA